LLKLVAPNNNGIATIFKPTNVTSQALQVKEEKVASLKLGLQLRFLKVRAPSEFEAVFDTVQKKK
jgi:hypothetical protein